MPSKFSSVLPMLAAELSTAVTARREGGDTGLPAACYFELADQLRQDVRQQREELARAQHELKLAREEIAARDGLLQEARSVQSGLEEALADAAKSALVEASKLTAAKAEYDLLGDEKYALERKLAVSEETQLAQAESVKEAQVSLFIEQRKYYEAEALFKELRAKDRAAAASTLSELRTAQKLLLRAHHATLRAEGKGSATFELSALPAQDQLAAAVRWAEGLNAVKVEDALMRMNATTPSATPASSRPPPATGSKE